MKKNLLIIALLVSGQVLAQNPPPKFSLTGAARAVYFADGFTLKGDTTTLPRESSGHVMADLGAIVRPNASTEVLAMVRVRNDYGGFWGSGVSFDIRQLSVRGLIQNKFRYTVGDMDYALTPFTMRRTAPLLEALGSIPALRTFQQQLPGYDVFMSDDGSWRTQGASLDFGLLFKKGPSKLSNSLYAMRLRPGFGGAATEQWAYGGRTELLWESMPLRLGGTLVAVSDMPGTSASTELYASRVLTSDGDFGNGVLRLHWEVGNSFAQFTDPNQTIKRDFFYTMGLKIGQVLQLTYREVGPDFFSPAAQTTAYNPFGIPRSFRTVGNDRSLRRASMYDFTREAGLYRAAWSTSLGNDDATYLLLDPYGEATPNRRGVRLDWNPELGWDKLKLGVSADQFSEIRGSGTNELTRFFRAELRATFAHKAWELTGMYRLQQAWRNETNAEVPALQLSQPWMSLNVGHKFGEHLRIDAGLLSLQSRGFVFNAVRNAQNEIIDFDGRQLDYSELLPVLSMSYQASGKSTFQIGVLSSSIREAGQLMRIQSGFLSYFIAF